MRIGTVLWLVLATIAAVALARCERGYDTALPPPTGRETYSEILPVSIAGVERSFEMLADTGDDVHGTRIRYGDRARVEIVRLSSQAALDSYVQEQVLPRLAGYERHSSRRRDGAWQLRGRDQHARLYGWQNQHWLFVIEADSQHSFDEIVDRFAYIRRW